MLDGNPGSFLIEKKERKVKPNGAHQFKKK